jgi:hypothetical protein
MGVQVLILEQAALLFLARLTLLVAVKVAAVLTHITHLGAVALEVVEELVVQVERVGAQELLIKDLLEAMEYQALEGAQVVEEAQPIKVLTVATPILL